MGTVTNFSTDQTNDWVSNLQMIKKLTNPNTIIKQIKQKYLI